MAASYAGSNFILVRNKLLVSYAQCYSILNVRNESRMFIDFMEGILSDYVYNDYECGDVPGAYVHRSEYMPWT